MHARFYFRSGRSGLRPISMTRSVRLRSSRATGRPYFESGYLSVFDETAPAFRAGIACRRYRECFKAFPTALPQRHAMLRRKSIQGVGEEYFNPVPAMERTTRRHMERTVERDTHAVTSPHITAISRILPSVWSGTREAKYPPGIKCGEFDFHGDLHN